MLTKNIDSTKTATTAPEYTQAEDPNVRVFDNLYKNPFGKKQEDESDNYDPAGLFNY